MSEIDAKTPVPWALQPMVELIDHMEAGGKAVMILPARINHPATALSRGARGSERRMDNSVQKCYLKLHPMLSLMSTDHFPLV